jgi:hypothetical protein
MGKYPLLIQDGLEPPGPYFNGPNGFLNMASGDHVKQ